VITIEYCASELIIFAYYKGLLQIKLCCYRIMLFSSYHFASFILKKLTLQASNLQLSSDKQSYPYNYDIITSSVRSIRVYTYIDSSADESFSINRAREKPGAKSDDDAVKRLRISVVRWIRYVTCGRGFPWDFLLNRLVASSFRLRLFVALHHRKSFHPRKDWKCPARSKENPRGRRGICIFTLATSRARRKVASCLINTAEASSATITNEIKMRKRS